MQTSTFYIGLGVLFLLVLTVRVIQMRMKLRQSIGDGGDPELIRRIRVHANFVETAPLVLLGLMAADHLGADQIVLHAIGVSLFAGRLMHAIGLSRVDGSNVFRQGGMGLTLLSMGLVAAMCLFAAFVTD